MDQTGKMLLTLVVIGLWGLLLRPLFSSPAPAGAQAKPATVKPAPARSAGDEVVMLQYGGPHGDKFVVVSKGKISVWNLFTFNDHASLTLCDSKPLP
jgi:hypothetical protein